MINQTNIIVSDSSHTLSGRDSEEVLITRNVKHKGNLKRTKAEVSAKQISL